MLQGNSEKYFFKAKDHLLIYLSYKLEVFLVDTRVLLSSWNILGKRENKVSLVTLFKGGQFQLQTLFLLDFDCFCWILTDSPEYYIE